MCDYLEAMRSKSELQGAGDCTKNTIGYDQQSSSLRYFITRHYAIFNQNLSAEFRLKVSDDFLFLLIL